MVVQIFNSANYVEPAKEVTMNGSNIGHVYPFGDVLIYSAGDKATSIKATFEGKDEALAEAIALINDYRKENHFKQLYIDKYAFGIAQVREDSYWANLGFVEDQNPELLFLND